MVETKKRNRLIILAEYGAHANNEQNIEHGTTDNGSNTDIRFSKKDTFRV